MTGMFTAPQGRARLVVTMPPSPSRIESILAASPAAKLLAFTDTSDAFRHLAIKAQRRLVIMTPYLDAAGCAWVLDMFRHTSAPERVLVLQSDEELSKPGVERGLLLDLATSIQFYGSGDTDETFHSKIVLADGSDAYVGSANFLWRSKKANLECGLLVDGPVVSSIATLVDGVLGTFAIERENA
ncbi:phospholipase D-like domain-containing protein [Sinorhizobium meliloti]|uniref:phospholipase D-like domain-containing protein n=1 Tax=Rhizobium meliloti TaxID=382 RepID=UPI0004817993|nr:phospholipase D-like domain-containing protein [Sinorhizobium meliloti]ASP70515.1 hypothetical protein CDO28_02445 [Sinorhizobium meliloti]MDE3828941.1 hypothetical protein [Sinorhizobium meliloti]MDE3854970.1 hypothetical protein [Sinorhizobium meliloti]MDE4577022.1 phospholipase D-like domain-containing protein [Sinorhizobium meliloti]MDW9394322.1 hypothetical protein [Sinorhizobium meliloti]